MKKAIAIIEAHPRLMEIDQATQAALKSIKERRAFLQKQAEDLSKERDALLTQVNVQLAEFAQEEKLLPLDFDAKKHHFHYDAGALIVCDEEGGSGGLGALLGTIFGGPAS